MTNKEINKIVELQEKGVGYKKIAAEVGLSINTIKSYCRRHPIQANAVCKQCGKQIIQQSSRKAKLFCSDTCRSKWWRINSFSDKSEKMVSVPCEVCGNEIKSYPSEHRRFCSKKCYWDSLKKRGEVLNV